MSSLGIFDKETKTYKKVADLSKPAVIDSAMSDTSTNPVQNKVVKSYVDGTFKQKSLACMIGDGKTGYCQLCTIKINGPWINTPLEITVQERFRGTLDRLTVLFEGSMIMIQTLLALRYLVSSTVGIFQKELPQLGLSMGKKMNRGVILE